MNTYDIYGNGLSINKTISKLNEWLGRGCWVGLVWNGQTH